MRFGQHQVGNLVEHAMQIDRAGLSGSAAGELFEQGRHAIDLALDHPGMFGRAIIAVCGSDKLGRATNSGQRVAQLVSEVTCEQGHGLGPVGPFGQFPLADPFGHRVQLDQAFLAKHLEERIDDGAAGLKLNFPVR
jgi:hypothetical protein